MRSGGLEVIVSEQFCLLSNPTRDRQWCSTCPSSACQCMKNRLAQRVWPTNWENILRFWSIDPQENILTIEQNLFRLLSYHILIQKPDENIISTFLIFVFQRMLSFTAQLADLPKEHSSFHETIYIYYFPAILEMREILILLGRNNYANYHIHVTSSRMFRLMKCFMPCLYLFVPRACQNSTVVKKES